MISGTQHKATAVAVAWHHTGSPLTHLLLHGGVSFYPPNKTLSMKQQPQRWNDTMLVRNKWLPPLTCCCTVGLFCAACPSTSAEACLTREEECRRTEERARRPPSLCRSGKQGEKE